MADRPGAGILARAASGRLKQGLRSPATRIGTGSMARKDEISADEPHYLHAPRPASMPVSFRLRGNRLIVERLGSEQAIPLSQITEARLTYEPRSFAQKLYRTRLRLASGGNLSLHSVNFRSMVFSDRQEEAYAAFVKALLPAIARANPQAHFTAGRTPFVWGALIVTTIAIFLAIAYFVILALREGEGAAIAIGLFIGAAGLWQMLPIVRLNRPRDFHPQDPPAELMGG